MDTDSHAHRQVYREIAGHLRLVSLRLKYAEAADELSLLAAQYERLAEYGAQAASPLDSRGPSDE